MALSRSAVWNSRNRKAFHEYTLSDWMTYSPILLLPSEVRTPFWNYLSPNDRKNIREVCKTFRNEIDISTGLSIDLDERFFETRNISSTLPPSASKLRIWGCDRTYAYLSRLLYNARLITDVTFSGPTDIDHLKKVLGRCPNLCSITVTDHSQFDTRFIIPFKLRNVKSLHLGAMEKSRKQLPKKSSPPSPWSMYLDLLSHLTFPCLNRLAIEYILPRESSFSADYNSTFRVILKYIISHKMLSDLTIRLHKSETAIRSKSSQSIFALQPKEEAALHSISLKRLVASTDPEVGKIWEMILLHQKNLQLIDFLNQGTDWAFFSKIIKNNRSSLEVVRLRRLLPDVPLAKSTLRVDLGAFEFESCIKLKELFVSRFENSTREVCLKKRDQELPFLDRAASKFPELIRFKAIPKSLERLHVQGFTVKTNDLLTIRFLDQLKTLELQLLGFNPGNGFQTKEFLEQGAGDSVGNQRHEKMKKIPKDMSRDGFGVTSEVLKGVISQLRSLDTLFIEEFYNDHTDLGKEPHFAKAIRKINLIPGECHLKSLGYYGLLISRKDPISQRGDGDGDSDGVRIMERHQRGDLWDVRFNQYRHQYRTLMMQKKNARPL